MEGQEEQKKKELAKLKRQATEVASKIHDIVEDRLWSDFNEMPGLAQELVAACQKVKDFS